MANTTDEFLSPSLVEQVAFGGNHEFVFSLKRLECFLNAIEQFRHAKGKPRLTGKLVDADKAEAAATRRVEAAVGKGGGGCVLGSHRGARAANRPA